MAIRGDQELDILIKATIAGGGVVPQIHKSLIGKNNQNFLCSINIIKSKFSFLKIKMIYDKIIFLQRKYFFKFINQQNINFLKYLRIEILFFKTTF